MRFAGRRAVVTGGSSGIGKAAALELAREGANVAIIARGEGRLEAAKREIEAARRGPEQRIVAISADVSDAAQAESAVRESVAALGGLDLLIASAGIAHPGRFRELPLEIHERTMAVNYFGTLYVVRAALPTMEAQGRGNIVLVSSGAGLIGLYGYTPYSPTKFALRGLAEALRSEVKPSGVVVSIVYPPDTDTPQLIEENKTKPEETKRMTGTARMWSAEGVARVTLRGMERGAFAIAPGFEMAALYRLNSLVAPLLHRHFDGIVAKMRREKH